MIDLPGEPILQLLGTLSRGFQRLLPLNAARHRRGLAPPPPRLAR